MKRIEFHVGRERLKGAFYDGARVPKAPRPLVVLAHGLNSCRKEWYEFPQRLAEAGYAVLAFDFRGHGESDGERGLQSPERAQEDLRAAIEAGRKEFRVDPERLALVGHSLGASLVASAAPELDPTAVVLMAPVRRIRDEITAAELGGYAALHVLNAAVTLVHRGGLRVPYAPKYEQLFVERAAIERARAEPFLQRSIPIKNYRALVRGLDAERAARRVRAPTLVLLAEFDAMVGKHNSRRVYEALAGPKELVEVPQSGHSMAGDGRAAYVAQHVRDFLDRHLRA